MINGLYCVIKIVAFRLTVTVLVHVTGTQGDGTCKEKRKKTGGGDGLNFMKLWHCALFCVEVKFGDKEQDFYYIPTAKTEGLEKGRCNFES